MPSCAQSHTQEASFMPSCALSQAQCQVQNSEMKETQARPLPAPCLVGGVAVGQGESPANHYETDAQQCSLAAW